MWKVEKSGVRSFLSPILQRQKSQLFRVPCQFDELAVPFFELEVAGLVFSPNESNNLINDRSTQTCANPFYEDDEEVRRTN